MTLFTASSLLQRNRSITTIKKGPNKTLFRVSSYELETRCEIVTVKSRI